MKLYYSIKEVAEMLNVNASLLRFWESEFSQLRPRKNTGGSRCYTEKDIALLREIYHLTKECGYTLEGARLQLKKGHSIEKSNDQPAPTQPAEPANTERHIDPNTQTSLFDTDDTASSNETIRQLESQLQEAQAKNSSLQSQNRDLQSTINTQTDTRNQAIAALRQARQQLEDLKTSLLNK